MDVIFCIYLPIVFLILYFLVHRLLHKLQNLPPTPFPTLPIIGHLHLLRKPLHLRLSQISEKYGAVVFLQIGSRPVLLVSSPSAAEECLTKKNDAIFANRPRFLVGKTLGSNYTSLAWAPNGDHWRNLRRISSLELLSSHRLHLLSHVRVDEVQALILKLKEVSATGQPVNLRSAFFGLIFNVLMRMIGEKRYYGKDVENSEEASRFQQMVNETVRVGGQTLGDFMPIVNWFGLNKGIENKLMAIHVKRHQFMQDLIEYHRDQSSKTGLILDDQRTKKKTMIQILLSLHETDPEYYTDEMIRSLMLVLLQAGTDTTVGILEWAMSHLLNSPHLLKRAQQEIDNCVGEDSLINDLDVNELPLLNNIINETMRVHPTFPVIIPHESSEECIVGGYRVPRGTTLLVNARAIHNDPKYWVEPEKFNPDRFESKCADGLKFMPFGAGRRKCPGERLAMQTIGLVLASLIQCFDWERVSEKMVDLTSEGSAATASKAQALVGRCRLRPTMVNLVSRIENC